MPESQDYHETILMLLKSIIDKQEQLQEQIQRIENLLIERDTKK